MTTLAAVLEKQNQPLALRKLKIPTLAPFQVLVQMKYAGICRSQLNEIKGHKGNDPYLPHTMGHEGSGIILETGSEVTRVKKGDRVVVSWLKGKGNGAGPSTYQCVENDEVINSGPVSTFLNCAVVSQDRVLKLPEEVPFEIGALFGCAIPTGMGVVINQMNLNEDSTVAIFGAGGIGLSALIAAASFHPKKRIVVDISEEKLRLAKELGATDTIQSNASEEIYRLTEKRGVDYALECAGKKEVMEEAFRSVRSGGGKCIIAGNIPAQETISINPFDLICGKQIEGTWGGGIDYDIQIPHLMSLLKGKEDLLRKLIGKVAHLSEINELIQTMEKGKIARALINCE